VISFDLGGHPYTGHSNHYLQVKPHDSRASTPSFRPCSDWAHSSLEVFNVKLGCVSYLLMVGVMINGGDDGDDDRTSSPADWS
jgi:hypothetical protein